MPINWRSPRATYVVIDVDGVQFDFFHDYNVRIDLLQPGGEFHFSASLIRGKRGVRENLGSKGLAPGRKATLRLVTPLGTSLQHTGRIYSVQYETTEKGSTIGAVVRDHMFSLVHADVLPGFALNNVTFADVIRTVAYPFGFTPSDITIDADAARDMMSGKPAAGTKLSAMAPLNLEALKVEAAMPNAGENAFAFLQRHARRFGLLIWGTVDGRIIVGRPNYDQAPRYEIRSRTGYKGIENNAEGIRRKISFEQRPSAVHVFGRTSGGDFSRSDVHEIVYDQEVRETGIYAPITLHDPNVKDATQARERGQWELSHRRQTADVVQAQLARHCARDGTVYAIDTVAHVAYEEAGLDTDMYIVQRTFNATLAGTQTSVDLVPKHAIALGDGIMSQPKYEASRGVTPPKTNDPVPGPIVGSSVRPRVVLAADPISTIPGVVTTR